MNTEKYEMLKNNLAYAIREKDEEKIALLTQMLGMDEEQKKYFEKGLTGYPSCDKVWMKYYDENAWRKATTIPQDKTVWDVIEEKLLEYYDVPAIEYFKKQYSREDFTELVYTWAKTFKAMGVEKDEIVPFYGPFFPDVGAMALALNMIGATSYFLKLAITKEDLEKETEGCKVAVVYDGMWPVVADTFSDDRFKKVLVATTTDAMPSPKKEIVSFLSYMQNKKNKASLPSGEKFVWLDDAKNIAHYYTGKVKEDFVPNRNAFITTSSGTTVGGVLKATVATNESTITQLHMADSSGIQYFKGDRCLNDFPPTASTSLNVLFLLALYRGLTVVMDPRVSEKDFYNQIITLKPNIALTTGSIWDAFFQRVYQEMKQGKKFDFSYAKGWTVGGEGSEPSKFQFWNEIMKQANAPTDVFSGYGSSEFFSAIAVDNMKARSNLTNQRPVMGVGIPYAGITAGIFDEEGKELSYNQRGELWAKSTSAMKEYYKKPELTKKTLANGWVHSGDMAEIDENGFLYIWGRCSDHIKLADGTKLYWFDIANIIKEHPMIAEAVVLPVAVEDGNYNFVAHIAWNERMENAPTNETEELPYLQEINETLQKKLPDHVKVLAYAKHQPMLPYSPTTLKKDKNKLSKQTEGFYQVMDDEMQQVTFLPLENGAYEIKYDIIEKEKVKSLQK